MSPSSPVQPAAADHGLPPGRGLVVLLVVVALLAGYVGLAFLLHLRAIFAGSLFLFFWAGVEKMAPAAFVATLVGAVGGILNASLLQAGQVAAWGLDPGVAALAGLALLVLALYLLLIGRAPVLCNRAYMLYLTVGAIPQLSGRTMVADMVAGLLLAAGYFGIAAWAFRRSAARREPDAATGAAGAGPAQGPPPPAPRPHLPAAG